MPFPFFNDHPVFDFEPGKSQDMTIEYEKLWFNLDNERSYTIDTEKSERSFSIVQNTYELRGPQEYRDFMNALDYMEGRLKPVWVPSYMQDLIPIQDILADVMIVKSDPIFHALLPHPERKYVRFENVSGNTFYDEITSVAPDEGPGTNVLELAEGTTMSLASFARCSFLTLMRCDQDNIEIRHMTDIRGVTTCTLTFRTTYMWPDD